MNEVQMTEEQKAGIEEHRLCGLCGQTKDANCDGTGFDTGGGYFHSSCAAKHDAERREEREKQMEIVGKREACLICNRLLMVDRLAPHWGVDTAEGFTHQACIEKQAEIDLLMAAKDKRAAVIKARKVCKICQGMNEADWDPSQDTGVDSLEGAVAVFMHHACLAQQGKDIIVMRPVHKLVVHPMAKHAPAMAERSEEFMCLLNDIRDRGIEQPLFIDAEDRILDGRHRWMCAAKIGLQDLPCIVKPEAEVEDIVLRTLFHRRHYTKGQRAYVFALLGGFKPKKTKCLQNLKQNAKNADFKAELDLGPDQTKQCVELGISEALMFQAKQILGFFNEHTKLMPWNDVPALVVDAHGAANMERDGTHYTLREYFEPQLLDPVKPMGLGDALKGIAYKIKNCNEDGEHVSPRDAEKVDLFQRGFKQSIDRMFRLTDMMDVKPAIAEVIGTLDEEKLVQMNVFIADLRSVVKSRREAIEAEKAL